jgi:hypothetical protein
MARCSFLGDWPLVAVVSDATAKEMEPDSKGGMQASQGLSVSYVRLYSLQRHSYIHTLTVPGAPSPAFHNTADSTTEMEICRLHRRLVKRPRIMYGFKPTSLQNNLSLGD